MALSNMREEPRREITESVVGLLALGGFITGVYLLTHPVARYFLGSEKVEDLWLSVMIIILGGIISILVIMGVVYGTHAFGEEVCDWLRRIKVDPRPKQRYEIRTEMHWDEVSNTYTTTKHRVKVPS